MILNTKNTTYELRFSTRNSLGLLDLMGTDDLVSGLLGVLVKRDLCMMAKIMRLLAENKPTVDEVYDFIDDYREEHGCTACDLFRSIIQSMNDEYFFDTVMKKEEMEEILENPSGALVNLGLEKMTQDILNDETRETIKEMFMERMMGKTSGSEEAPAT